MKKTLALTLTLAFLFSFFSATVIANNEEKTITFRVSHTSSVSVGKKVAVNIEVDTSQLVSEQHGVSSFNGRMSFDSAMLKYVGSEKHMPISEWETGSVEEAEDFINLNFECGKSNYDKVVTNKKTAIIVLYFEVLDANYDDEGNGNFTLIINECNTLTNGDVTYNFIVSNDLPEILAGDVNGNKKVELSDAMKAFQHVAKKIVLTGEEFAAADVNNDGSIQLDDAMKIFQVVAKKANVIGHLIKQVTVSPTCTEKGYTAYSCSCGAELGNDNYKDALGHSWSNWKVTVPPSDTVKGTEGRTCTRCEQTESREFDIALHTHSYTTEVVAATCYEQGYTLHKCGCGYSYKDTYTPIEHVWSEWTVTKEATEYSEGTMTRKCSRCGKTETESIPKTEVYEAALPITKGYSTFLKLTSYTMNNKNKGFYVRVRDYSNTPTMSVTNIPNNNYGVHVKFADASGNIKEFNLIFENYEKNIIKYGGIEYTIKNGTYTIEYSPRFS